MWLLRVFVFVLLLAVFVILAGQNNKEPGVDLELFVWSFTGIKLWWIMFAAALFGFLIGLLVSAFREIKLRMDFSKLRRDKIVLEREISELRAAPLHDLGPSTGTTQLPSKFSE